MYVILSFYCSCHVPGSLVLRLRTTYHVPWTMAFGRHISLPCLSFGRLPGLSSQVLTHGSGGLGSLNCLQENFELRPEDVQFWRRMMIGWFLSFLTVFLVFDWWVWTSFPFLCFPLFWWKWSVADPGSHLMNSLFLQKQCLLYQCTIFYFIGVSSDWSKCGGVFLTSYGVTFGVRP